jgi:hypothetical protein
MNNAQQTDAFVRMLPDNIKKEMLVEEEDGNGNVIRKWKVAGHHEARKPKNPPHGSFYIQWSLGWVLRAANGAKRLVFPEDMIETKYFVLE